jgi:hypothetical protein
MAESLCGLCQNVKEITDISVVRNIDISSVEAVSM